MKNAIIILFIGLIILSFTLAYVAEKTDDRITGIAMEVYTTVKTVEKNRVLFEDKLFNISWIVLEKEIKKAKDILKKKFPDLYYDSIGFSWVRYSDDWEYIIDLYISWSIMSKYAGNTYCVSKSGIISRF
jgi:hypothetical protein